MDVSIVIRAKNEAEKIGLCLERIYAQKTNLAFEVIVIDSGSTDDTLSIVRRHPARLYQIPPEEFNYGKALNDGVGYAQGYFIVCCSAHAIPADEAWLEGLVKPLLESSLVAGTCSREVYDADCNLIEASRVARTFPPVEKVYDMGCASDETDRATILGEMVFSNVSSCMPRELLRQHQFEHLSYGEDHAWASTMLALGYRVVYQPASRIVHYHNETPDQVARRFFNIGRSQREKKCMVTWKNGAAMWVRNVVYDYRYVCHRETRLPHRLRWGLRLLQHWAVATRSYMKGARG